MITLSIKELIVRIRYFLFSKKRLHFKINGAGDGNRTHVVSLEG